MHHGMCVLEQLNPSPTVNGAWHEQVKFPLNKLSLIQSALGSQGEDKQGSGTATWIFNNIHHTVDFTKS